MKILLIVDVQKGFTRTDKTKETAKRIVDLSNSGSFDFIIASRFVNKDDSPYVKYLNWNRLMTSPETDLVDNLKYDIHFDKETYTCWSSKLENILRSCNKGILPTEIYLCGIDTDCCVLNTAVDLFENNIKPLILIDYCFSNGGQEYHDSAIKVLERNVGKQSIVRDFNNFKQ